MAIPCPCTSQLPGTLNIIPRICIGVRIGNVFGKFIIRVYKVEFPGSVQQAVILASFELATNASARLLYVIKEVRGYSLLTSTTCTSCQ